MFCRLEQADDLDKNRLNLVALTQKVFDAIINSADRFPPQLRSMCHCLYQVLSKRFPNLLQNNIGAVGTVIFLRFINPAIGKLVLILFLELIPNFKTGYRVNFIMCTYLRSHSRSVAAVEALLIYLLGY